MSVALAGAAAVGCGSKDDGPWIEGNDPVPSSVVSTSELSALVVATADGDGNVRVLGSLERERGRSVRVEAPDTFLAGTDAHALVALSPRLFTPTDYMTYVATLPESGAPLTVTLLRGDVALESHISIPAPFDLAVFRSQPTFSRAKDDITLTFTHRADDVRMYWEASGDCIDLAGDVDITGDGSFTIPKGTFHSKFADACDVTIRVRRSLGGSADARFARATILGEQLRSVTITTTP